MDNPGQPGGENYYRPDNMPSGDYQPDKIIGIIVMVLSLCGVCGGLGMLGLGGMMAAAGGSVAAQGTEGAAGAAVAGGLGALTGVIGGVIILLSLGQAVVGYGIMKSLRWGFTVGMVLSGISALFNIVSIVGGNLPGILSLLISGSLCYYCWARLNGKQGPPVAA